MEAAQKKFPQQTVESVIYFKAIKDNSSCSISSAKKEIIAELRDKRVSLKRRVDFKGSIGATILDKFLCKNKPNCQSNHKIYPYGLLCRRRFSNLRNMDKYYVAVALTEPVDHLAFQPHRTETKVVGSSEETIVDVKNDCLGLRRLPKLLDELGKLASSDKPAAKSEFGRKMSMQINRPLFRELDLVVLHTIENLKDTQNGDHSTLILNTLSTISYHSKEGSMLDVESLLFEIFGREFALDLTGENDPRVTTTLKNANNPLEAELISKDYSNNALEEIELVKLSQYDLQGFRRYIARELPFWISMMLKCEAKLLIELISYSLNRNVIVSKDSLTVVEMIKQSSADQPLSTAQEQACKLAKVPFNEKLFPKQFTEAMQKCYVSNQTPNEAALQSYGESDSLVWQIKQLKHRRSTHRKKHKAIFDTDLGLTQQIKRLQREQIKSKGKGDVLFAAEVSRHTVDFVTESALKEQKTLLNEDKGFKINSAMMAVVPAKMSVLQGVMKETLDDAKIIISEEEREKRCFNPPSPEKKQSIYEHIMSFDRSIRFVARQAEKKTEKKDSEEELVSNTNSNRSSQDSEKMQGVKGLASAQLDGT